MAYPQAPWTLHGYAIQTLQLLDVERVRPFIPPELKLISVFPGKTVGGVYVSYYGSGSVLEYSELIVVGGLVSYAGKLGGWISHIYVDNTDSVAGGREIWGLPKELAEFTWDKGNASGAVAEPNPGPGQQNSVTVRQGDRLLCRLSYSRQSFTWQLPFSGNVFSTLDSSILLFNGRVESRMGLVSGKLTVPPESPFGSLELSQPWLTVYCDPLRFIADVPEAVGHRQRDFSYR
ncbi:MAG TPA: acetoacetate decarboxylase family protein [Coleofasciculaceae cyanobacterium]|jgi:hypothetical protein